MLINNSDSQQLIDPWGVPITLIASWTTLQACDFISVWWHGIRFPWADLKRLERIFVVVHHKQVAAIL